MGEELLGIAVGLSAAFGAVAQASRDVGELERRHDQLFPTPPRIKRAKFGKHSPHRTPRKRRGKITLSKKGLFEKVIGPQGAGEEKENPVDMLIDGQNSKMAKTASWRKYSRDRRNSKYSRAGRARRFYQRVGKRRGGRYRRPSKKYRKAKRLLQVYPAAVPNTHIVKFKVLAQTQLTTLAAGWGGIIFEPANAARPLKHLLLVSVSGDDGTSGDDYMHANHQRLKWADRAGTAVSPLNNRQCEGWDSWLSGLYARGVVLGAKITVTTAPGTTQASAARLVAGFNTKGGGLYIGHDHVNEGLESFGTKYANTTSGEVAAAIDNDVFGTGASQLVLAGAGAPLEAPQSWTFFYSLNNLQKTLKRKQNFNSAAINADTSFEGVHGEPAYSPYCVFNVADIGSSAAVSLNLFVKVEYTVRLYDRVLPSASVFA